MTAIENTIALADAPAISDLTFRAFRDLSDVPAMVEIDNAFNAAHNMEFVTTVDELANELANPDDLDPKRDVLLAEIGGKPVGFARVFRSVNDEGEQVFTLNGVIHPNWLRRGIGRAMLHWCEQHARELAQVYAHNGPRVMQTWAFDTMPGKIALVEQEGYERIRYGFQMVRPLSEPIPDLPLPEGIEIRPKLREHFRLVFDAMNEAFRDHWGHREMTENDWQEFLKWPDHQPELCQVAWDAAKNEVAGEVRVTIFARDNDVFHLKRGWTDPIFVRRPYRKQGLAKALIVRAMQVIQSKGMDEAALFVDALNPNGALKLYESLGYRVHRRTFTYRKPLITGR